MSASSPLLDPVKFAGSDVEKGVLLNQLYGKIARRLESPDSPPVESLDRLTLNANPAATHTLNARSQPANIQATIPARYKQSASSVSYDKNPFTSAIACLTCVLEYFGFRSLTCFTNFASS